MERAGKTEEDLAGMLAKGARELGVELTGSMSGQLFAFIRELKKWNARINLTGIGTDREIITGHFLDSLTPARPIIDNGAQTVLDIGTGGGFPGIPLKIAMPGLEVVLLESTGKKVSFLRHVIRTLGLEKIDVCHGRAEDPAIIRELTAAGGFDCVISRALTGLRACIELSRPYAKKQGVIMAMKGPLEGRLEKELEGIACELREIPVPFTDRKTTLVIVRQVV